MKLYERRDYGNYGIGHHFSDYFARCWYIYFIRCSLYSFVALKLKADLQGLLAFDIFTRNLMELKYTIKGAKMDYEDLNIYDAIAIATAFILLGLLTVFPFIVF